MPEFPLSIETFLLQHPEWSFVDPEVLQKALTVAEARTGSNWAADPRRNEYVGLLASHHLCRSPVGRDARMVDPKGAITAYERDICRLQREFAVLVLRGGIDSDADPI